MGKVASSFLNLILSALLTRFFSPDNVGVFFLALSISTFFSFFALSGLENTLLRFISEAVGNGQVDRLKSILIKSSVIFILSSIIMVGIVYAGAGNWVAQKVFQSAILGQAAGFVAIWLVLLSWKTLFHAIFRAFQDIRSAVVFGGLLSDLIVIVLLIFNWVLIREISLNNVFMFVVISGMVNFILAIRGIVVKINGIPGNGDNQVTYREIVEHSWPLMLNAITMYIMTKADLWILAAFRSDAEVAIYGTVVWLVMITSISLAIVNTVLPPLIGRLNVQNEKEKLERLMRTIASVTFLPAFIILIIFIFFGEEVLTFVFGEYYSSGFNILIILCIGQVVNVAAGSCGYSLIMSGYQRTIMAISILTSIIGVSVGILSVQNYGSIGVAVGSTVGVIFQQALMMVSVRYRCGYWTHVSIPYLLEAVPQLLNFFKNKKKS